MVTKGKVNAMPASNKSPEPLDSGKVLSAILALLVADREERVAANGDGKGLRKTEVILTAGGLTAAEIAPLVGKNLEAVRKTIQRGKGK
jgi:DNA-directed RNA polymerase specialized sigma24 family protein